MSRLSQRNRVKAETVAAGVSRTSAPASPHPRAKLVILRQPDDIIDADQLDRALAEAAEAPNPRAALVDIGKAVLKKGTAEIERRFLLEQNGAMVLSANTLLIDTLVRALHRVATSRLFPLSNPTKGEALAIGAVGGYGRGEMAPHSDIDLLFLLPYKETPYTEQIVEFLYYTLWDLGLKVGHSTRSIDECIRQAKADLTVQTSLLEARFLSGDELLFRSLHDRFEREIIEGNAIAFVDGKLHEREERHRKLGDSRYVLEPNVKEGKGALRDLHGLLWIAKYIFRIDTLDQLVQRGVLLPDEAHRFTRDQMFLWTVRCHLHYLTGRPEDRLTFEVQTEIGRRMGYTDHAGTRGVERFMKHYFLIAKDVGDLTRIFIAVVESEQKRKPQSLWRWLLPGGQSKTIEGFTLDGNRLSANSEEVFKRDPVNLIRLFHVAQAHDLDIHPRVLRQVTQSLRLIDAQFRQNPEANRLFMEILVSPKEAETALRRMSEAGVLGRFIPDFGRVIAQMQYDMYHVYTTDEHTLFAVGSLNEIEAGQLKDELPLISSIIGSVTSRRALYLAVFLHDIAKGRGGDHSEIGAKIALSLGPRLGLTAEETESVAWLVLHHLDMSRVAFKRDLEDPKTIQDFVATVQSPERLKLLTVLTAVDIRAVGPNVWNPWKGALLRTLFNRASELMNGTVSADARDVRIARTQQAIRVLLPEFSDEDFATFTQRGYPSYWVSNDPETMARHARLMNDAERRKAPLTVTNRVDMRQSVTEITVYTSDHAGLFSRIAGALSVAGAHIVDARIVTMANGMALDTFWIQELDGRAFSRPDKLARLAVQLENVLSGKLKPHVELKQVPPFLSRTSVFTVPPRVLIDNAASITFTVIEVNGRDRPALLFDLTRALSGLGLQIAGAKISTYGEKVVDVFFVKDVFGLKVDRATKLTEIKRVLNAVLSDANGLKRDKIIEKLSA